MKKKLTIFNAPKNFRRLWRQSSHRVHLAPPHLPLTAVRRPIAVVVDRPPSFGCAPTALSLTVDRAGGGGGGCRCTTLCRCCGTRNACPSGAFHWALGGLACTCLRRGSTTASGGRTSRTPAPAAPDTASAAAPRPVPRSSLGPEPPAAGPSAASAHRVCQRRWPPPARSH